MGSDIFLLAQLVSSMKDAVSKLEIAKDKNDAENFIQIKKFILDLQLKIDAEAGRILE